MSSGARAPRELGVLIGAGDRGPIFSAGIVFGSIVVLALSVVSTAPLKIVAPVTLLAIGLTTGYRKSCAGRSSALVLVVLFIPIRRYTLPGGLPFQLEPYRLMTAF